MLFATRGRGGAIQLSSRPGILTTIASLIASKSRTPLLFLTVSRVATYGSAGRSGPPRLFRRATLHYFLQLRRGPPFMGPAARGPPLLHHWSSLIILVCSVHAKRFDCSRFFYIHFENLEFHPGLTQGRFYGGLKGAKPPQRSKLAPLLAPSSEK